jgi:glycosyltransferase involved in cell wall biosynthesis
VRHLLSVVHGPVYGGGHNQMIRLREPLRHRGFDTLALVPTEPGSARPRLEAEGVEVVALPLGRLRATANPLTHARFAAGMRREVRAIRRLIRERSIDLVQVHGPTNPHAAIAARLERVPVVWQIYEDRAPMIARRVTMPLVQRLADVLMTTGLGMARVHPGALSFGDRLVTYVPPVDVGEFRPDSERRAAARAELALRDEDVAIGTVANLNPAKGHEFLVRAAARLRERHPELQLRILGAHSPAHAAYEAEVREEAARLGLVDAGAIGFLDPGTRVAELLPALDVFVLASLWEGIPTVLLESMACEVPVVSTDAGAVSEVVEDGVNGLVVAAGDPEALAGAVGRLLDDEDLRGRLASEGRRAVTERWDVESCADVHARAYRMALGLSEAPPRLAEVGRR